MRLQRDDCLNFFCHAQLQHFASPRPVFTRFAGKYQILRRFLCTTEDLFSLPQTLFLLWGWGNIAHHIFNADLSIIHNPCLEMDFLKMNNATFLLPLAAGVLRVRRYTQTWMIYPLFLQMNGNTVIALRTHFISLQQIRQRSYYTNGNIFTPDFSSACWPQTPSIHADRDLPFVQVTYCFISDVLRIYSTGKRVLTLLFNEITTKC